MLTSADKGGMGGGWQMQKLADKRGKGGLHPPILADIFCEEPLIKLIVNKLKC